MIYIPLTIAALLLLVAIVIYINPGPKVNQGEGSAWLKKIPIAHRGLHTDDANVPENSMEAFRRAVAMGYAIEFDVQLSSDGKVFVFHDENLQRMTGLNMNINALSAEQIKALRLLESKENIPSFKEVLALVQGKVPLLIEIKNDGSVGKLEAAVIEELNSYSGAYAIEAFNPFVLKYLKKHAPEVIRGQLSASFKGQKLASWKKFLLRYLLLNSISNPHFVAYETGVLPNWFVRRLRKKGLHLITWTTRSMEDYERDLKTFDNVIFEGFRPPNRI